MERTKDGEMEEWKEGCVEGGGDVENTCIMWTDIPRSDAY